MDAKQLIEREVYVAIHGQTWKFRVVKHVILIGVFTGIWLWQGLQAVFIVFGVLLVVVLAMHFLFRWKTKAWTASWGPYKKLKLPE